MHNKLILAILGLMVAAGLGIFLIPGLLGSRGPAQVTWTPEDEVQVEGEPVDPETVGPGGDITRTAIDTPKAAEAVDDSESRRPMIGVHGRVVDSGHVPIAGAVVVLQLNAGFRGGPGGGRGGRGPDRQQVNKPVTTGADGTFLFKGRGYENPTITVVVSHTGHAPTIYDKQFTSKGGDHDVGDVTLTAGGSILGAVTDMDNNAVPGTTATLSPSGGNRLNWLRNREDLLPKLVVDGSGTFRVVNVMPGEYRIEATAPRKISTNTDTFTVVDGQEERLETLRLGPGHELRGLVVNQQGTPVASADVELNGGGRGRGFQTQTDKKGEFVIDHVPSEPAVTLRVQAKGYVTFVQPAVKPPEAAPFIVRLQDGLRITGVVRDQANGSPVTRYAAKARRVGGLPNANADLAGGNDPQAMRDQFRRMMDGSLSEAESAAMRAQFDEMRRNGGGPGGGRGNGGRRGGNNAGDNAGPGRRGGNNGVEFGRGMMGGDPNGTQPGDPGEVLPRPDGAFSFTGLDEGTYVVDIGSPDHQRLRSERVVVQTGGVAPNLTLMLVAGLDLSGKVVSSADGSAIAGAQVELVLAREPQPQQQNQGSQPGGRGRGGNNPMRQFFMGNAPTGMPVAEVRSGKDGTFAFKHVAAGRYQLVAQAEGHSRRVSDAFDLAVTTTGAALELGALASLEGKVLNVPRGKEETAQVAVFAGMQNMKIERLKSDGTYKISDLEPGDYVVRAFLGDMRTFFRLEMQTRGLAQDAFKPDVSLHDGEAKILDLAITLHPLGQVAGNVQKNGMPAKGLRVLLESVDAAQANPQSAQGGGRGGRGGQQGGPGGGRGGGRGGFGGGIAPVVTDARGDFTFADVPEGRYLVKVQQNGANQDLWHQEVNVRADDTQRVIASLQTGGISGRVKTDEKDAGDLSGSVMLYAGTKTVPQDVGEFQKTSTMYRLPLRSGVFSLADIPSGEYLLVLQPRNREPVQQNVFVPLGDTLNLELAPGAKRAQGAGTGGRGGQTPPAQTPPRQNR